MTIALTAYPVEGAASTTLSTANPLVAVTGGTLAGANNVLTSNSLNFGEMYSQGNSGAWLGHSGAITDAACNPSGHGWFFDATTLDGQTIIAGNWTPTWSYKVSTGSFTADIYIRTFVYNGGTYTIIGSAMLLAGQTITGTTGYTFSATSLPAASFPTGSKLYIDNWLNITAAGTSGATTAARQTSSATQGNAGAQIVTPGYQPTSGGGPPFSRIITSDSLSAGWH